MDDAPHGSAQTEPVSPLTALAQRWRAAAALTLTGLAAGLLAAQLLPTTYTGEARVAVGSRSLDARVVAGYSQAAQQLAADIARYVDDQQAQDDLEPVLGEAAGDVERVDASPIAGSSVLRIEVRADSERAALQGATTVAETLVEEVNAATQEGPQTLLDEYTRLTQQVAEEQAALQAAQAELGAVEALRLPPPEDLAAARQAVAEATTRLDVVQVQQTAMATRYRNAVTSTSPAAGLQIVAPAEIARDDRASAMQRYGLLGAAAGGLLALLLATWSDRRRVQRARTSTADPQAAGARVDPPLEVGGRDHVRSR